jgi:hypothetical protein
VSNQQPRTDEESVCPECGASFCDHDKPCHYCPACDDAERGGF